MEPVRVSVIVPVFNPGPGFDELIRSLDRQTLEQQQFEVILCDDGSDESTRRRLQHTASVRSNVRVLTLPHTGWPGTPRNHGIRAARGEYAFFADQDDRLFEGALQRLCDYADRCASDVVIGRVVGVGREISSRLFRRDVPRAVLGEDPLLDLLTPHKLFRSSFLREHDIWFPDGRVRLEDHLFVMKAYFAADTISILASEPCYAWVRNEGSASSSRIDPASYFPHLVTVLDLVEANTSPGPLRDTLLRHWYRTKILRRLDGKRVSRYPDDYRTAFLDAVIPIAQERFGDGVEEELPFPLRIRSALLRAGRREELLQLAAFEAELQCRAEVTSARWARTGNLALAVGIKVARGGEEALVFDPAVPRVPGASQTAGGQGRVWRPPAPLHPDFLPREMLDATRDLRQSRVELLLSEGADSQRPISVRSLPHSLVARVTIDPLRVFANPDRSTGGKLRVRVRYAGWTLETRLRAPESVVDGIGRSPFLAGRRCRLLVSGDGTLELRLQGRAGAASDLAARFVRRAGRLASRYLPARARELIRRSLS